MAKVAPELAEAYSKFCREPDTDIKNAILEANHCEVRRTIHSLNNVSVGVSDTDNYACTLLVNDVTTSIALFDKFDHDTVVFKVLLSNFSRVHTVLLPALVAQDLRAGKLHLMHRLIQKQLNALVQADQTPLAFCVTWRDDDRVFAYFEDSVILPNVASWKVGNDARLSDGQGHHTLAASVKALFPERTCEVVRILGMFESANV